MEKFWKYFKRIVIGIVVTTLVLLSSMFIFGKIGKASDRKKIEDYGEKVEVFGKNINMYITGEGEGKETIVLLPGYGTIAPKISFDPVTEKLKDDYRVVLVEPFGYGLSDQTDRERTTANMVEEIHMALQAKGIDDFIFMGHSIAGIYMLSYINTYPGEAKAFIGIDTSVPTQPMFPMDTTVLRLAINSVSYDLQ
ncbi:alpha/beta hydrolase [Erysipelothrix sp. D19-032]